MPTIAEFILQQSLLGPGNTVSDLIQNPRDCLMTGDILQTVEGPIGGVTASSEPVDGTISGVGVTPDGSVTPVAPVPDGAILEVSAPVDGTIKPVQ